MDRVESVRQELMKFQYVQFTVCDINGVSRGKIVPVRNKDNFENGVFIYAGVRHVEIFDTERNNLGEIRSSKVNSPTSAKFVWNRKYTIDTVYHLSSNDREVRSDRDIANALGVCDTNGISRGKVVPIRNTDNFEKGVFASSAILMLGHKDELVLQKDGSNRVYENMVMIPDLDTIHPIPWAGSGTFKFTVCDTNGISRGKVVPIRNTDNFEKGVFVSSAVLMLGHKDELVLPKDESNRVYGNMIMIPDLDTLHPIPWAGSGKYKVCEFYCETVWSSSLKYQEACPRYIAKRQLQRLNDLGYMAFSGFEMEFVLKNLQTNVAIFDGAQFCINKVFRRIDTFLFDLDTKLLESGVDIGEFHLEYCPGMIECVMTPQWGMITPDSTFGFVQGVLEMAEQHGLLPTFTVKSNMAEPGVGTHFSLSLWTSDKKVNLFHDPSKADRLSDTARWWIGGLVKHSGALTALCSPTVNCYRRLFKERTPGKCIWDIDDRHATFRVKNDDMKNTYIENRIPSGKCNPYLVYAATIAAGVDGVINKVQCPPRNDPSAPELPSSLAAALDALEQDDVMVSALSKQFVDWFVQLKKETEVEPLRGKNAPKDDEKRLLLEIEMYK